MSLVWSSAGQQVTFVGAGVVHLQVLVRVRARLAEHGRRHVDRAARLALADRVHLSQCGRLDAAC